jgi:hypothetical protein
MPSLSCDSIDDVSVLPAVTVTAVTTLSNDAIITREREGRVREGERERGNCSKQQLPAKFKLLRIIHSKLQMSDFINKGYLGSLAH